MDTGLLADHEILTLATNRDGGCPGDHRSYVNDGLERYMITFPESQKVRNRRRGPRVSLTIDRDYADWNLIKGLSIAATARFVTAPEALRDTEQRMRRKFLQLEKMQMPDPSALTFLRLRPEVISVPRTGQTLAGSTPGRREPRPFEDL